MGFHKRWITEEVLIDKYRRGGIEEIKSYLGHADAFVMNDDLSSDVIDLFNSSDIDEIKKWNLISEKISARSIKLWNFNK